MTDLKYVTYCGLYCRLCSKTARIPQLAKALQDTMKKDDYESFGPSIPGFDVFWQWLSGLAVPQDPSCRSGCGNPNCAIRECAQERGQEICVYCEDYPCTRFHQLRNDPITVADGEMLKAMGIDAWIEEQERRCQRGVCYSDIRYDASD